MIRALGALALAIAAARQDGDEWEKARALRDVDPRAAAQHAERALAHERTAPAAADQRLAFELALGLLGAEDVEAALSLQRALHARVGAPWSAHDLAQTLVRTGDVVGAERVLADAWARAPRSALLANARGLVALGAGDERTARTHLGTALRLGDAGARATLARLEWLRGNTRAACALFGAGMDAPEPVDWALRGWALGLLSTTEEGAANSAVREDPDSFAVPAAVRGS